MPMAGSLYEIVNYTSYIVNQSIYWYSYYCCIWLMMVIEPSPMHDPRDSRQQQHHAIDRCPDSRPQHHLSSICLRPVIRFFCYTRRYHHRFVILDTTSTMIALYYAAVAFCSERGLMWWWWPHAPQPTLFCCRDDRPEHEQKYPARMIKSPCSYSYCRIYFEVWYYLSILAYSSVSYDVYKCINNARTHIQQQYRQRVHTASSRTRQQPSQSKAPRLTRHSLLSQHFGTLAEWSFNQVLRSKSKYLLRTINTHL